MDSEEQVLVRRSSNHVCRSQESPVKDRGIAEEIRACQLNRHDEENDPFRQGLGAAEFGDLKVKIEVSNCGSGTVARYQGNNAATSATAGWKTPSQGLGGLERS